MVQRGAAAVPVLLAALQENIAPGHRKAILRILVELSDTRAEPVFRSSLSSTDEEIRALAAQGLVKLNATDAMAACLATINDAPDMLHADVTPSVHALASMGMLVLPALLPLLMSSDARTRQRGQKVLEQVTFDKVSRVVQPRPLSDAARTAWMALWATNGSYQSDGPESDRAASVDLWTRWLQTEEQH